MIDFVIERDIARRPADVFAYVTDASRLATWQTNTVSAKPDGAIAVGTKIREVHRAPGGGLSSARRIALEGVGDHVAMGP